MPRFLSFLALALVITFPTVSRTADKDAASKPTVTVRLRPIDGLISDALYLAKAAGKAEEAKQVDGFLQAFITDEGLKGVDTKRPIGVYSVLTADVIGSLNVVLVPIASEKAFLDFLEVLNQKVTKGKDGVYTVSPPQLPVSIHFRFANKYVYITAPEKAAIAKDKLLDPTEVLSAGDTSLLSAAINLDQIPDELKQIVLAQIDVKLSEEQDKKLPNENAAQRAGRVETLKEISRIMTSVIKEGGKLEMRLGLDQQAKALTSELSLGGKSKSKLSASLVDLGQSKSLFTGLKSTDAAASGLLHLAFSAELRKALEPVFDDGIATVLKGEQDEARRAAAEKVLTAVKPTLKALELDAGFLLSGPNQDKLYTFVTGIKLVKGDGIEQAIRDLIKNVPERERALIKLDAEKVGDISIHRIDAQQTFKEDARARLGDNPLYIAFRSDSVWLSGGTDGLAALKTALKAQAAAGPLFQLELSLARLAPTFGNQDAERTKQIVQAAKEIFTKAGDDKVIAVVQGGKELKATFNVKTAVMQFLARVGEIDKKGN